MAQDQPQYPQDPANGQPSVDSLAAFAIDNRHNMLRQALRAALFAHLSHLDAHLADHPGAAPEVAMARELLDYLQSYVQGPLDREIQLAEWWALHQGSSNSFVNYLNTKCEALALLALLFDSLKRLGVTVLHERKA